MRWMVLHCAMVDNLLCFSETKNRKGKTTTSSLVQQLKYGTNLRNRFKQMTEVLSLENSSKNTVLTQNTQFYISHVGFCPRK